MTCPHTHVFFNSNGNGICLDCDGAIERTKAFDSTKADKQPTEPSEAQALRTQLALAVQEIALVRTALGLNIALQNLQSERELSPDEYFWAYLRLDLRFQKTLKHANELAVDRVQSSQKNEKSL